ncbi:type II secretion system protein [Massilia sp. SYSU DXS3249]
MNKSMKGQQGGFTLIELIVVIVILGILAATALPRFASLGGEARLASLNAAKGALSATSAMTHGRFLLARAENIAVEGINVPMNLASGYPSVSNATQAQALADASGLTTSDYTVFVEGAADANRPAVAANQLAIVPNSIVGTPTAATCYVMYTAAVARDTAPAYAVGVPGKGAADRVKDCE